MVIQVLRSLGSSILLHPGTTVVNSVSTEDKEEVATVEGKIIVPSQMVLEAVETPILGPKV